MERTVKLSKRLQAAADYVKVGSAVIDVGTDHGYIPVYLVQNNIAMTVIASDIKRGPLESAVESARSCGVEEKIRFCLADGLPGQSGGADTVIIAGMGAETIIHILAAAPWTKEGVDLILQPQSKIDELSSWLDSNGYAICDEKLVRDEGKYYIVMLVRGGKSRGPFTNAQLLVDSILMKKREELLPEYLDFLIKKLTKAYQGLLKSRQPDILEKIRLEMTLGQLREMMEETKQW